LPKLTSIMKQSTIVDLRNVGDRDELIAHGLIHETVWHWGEMKRMTSSRSRGAAMLALVIAVDLALSPRAIGAAPPTAEVAKRCLHFAYIAYPWKRPGAVPMSGDRETWFRDCLAKNGEVPEPAGPAKPQPQVPGKNPASNAASSSAGSNPPVQTGR
jgi:hypothetical protein